MLYTSLVQAEIANLTACATGDVGATNLRTLADICGNNAYGLHLTHDYGTSLAAAVIADLEIGHCERMTYDRHGWPVSRPFGHLDQAMCAQILATDPFQTHA